MKNNVNVVTCSFKMDRELYNAYKSIIVRNGENVKGNIINYMRNVVEYETPNAETIEAMQEVEDMIKNGTGKRYNSVSELFEELNA